MKKPRHKLLERQVRKFLSSDQVEAAGPFLDAIESSYLGFESDHALMERAMDLSSQELMGQNAELQSLYHILSAINGADSLLVAYPAILLEIQKLTNAKYLVVEHFDAESQTLKLVASVGFPGVAPETVSWEMPVALSPAGKFVQERLNSQTTAVSDWRRVEAAWVTCLGIQAKSNYLGVLSLGTTAEQGPCPDRIVKWLELVAANIAIAIDRIRSRRFLERQKAELVASAKLSDLGSMAGGICHELNNPLAIVCTLAEQVQELVQDKSPDPQAIGQATTEIAATARRIATIVENLKTFSRDSGQDPLQRVELREVVENTLLLCTQSLASRGIKVEVSVPEKVLINCRSAQISQVLLNLLNNSAEALDRLPEKWIRISYQSEGGSPVLLVTDSGKGIPVNIREKIFNPFFTTKAVGKGMGLGLSVAHGIMEQHGGALTYNEAAPQTQFMIRFKAVQGDAVEKAAA